VQVIKAYLELGAQLHSVLTSALDVSNDLQAPATSPPV